MGEIKDFENKNVTVDGEPALNEKEQDTPAEIVELPEKKDEVPKKDNKKTLTRVVIAVLLVIIALLLWKSCSKEPAKAPAKEGNLTIDTRSGEKEEEASLADVLKDRQVFFSGIEDAVISKETKVYLENPKENQDILMKYEVIDKESGEVVETTDLIPAGESVTWMAGEVLTIGEHTLIFHEMPYYPWEEAENGYYPLTQGNNEVVFAVK